MMKISLECEPKLVNYVASMLYDNGVQ